MNFAKVEYKIAIPSYKRKECLVNQTLRFLMEKNVDPKIITVFVASETEQRLYKEEITKAGYNIEVVIGVPGLLNQRRWYNTDFYQKGTKVLNLDDDITCLYKKTENDKLELYDGSLQDIVDHGFGLCEKYGARLWGINAALNGMFMKNSSTIGLRYICGIFHGSYAGDSVICDSDRVCESSGEDFETTLRSFSKYGKVVRLDGYAPKTKYFANGGMQAELGGKESRAKDHDSSLIRIADKYPTFASIYKKSGGVTNIKLKPVTEVQLDWNETVESSSLDDLFG